MDYAALKCPHIALPPAHAPSVVPEKTNEISKTL